MEPKFKIGDTVFHATAGQETIWVTCPECLGSGTLSVILGDNSRVTIACTCCARGYEGSPGKIQSYAFKARVQEVVVTGLDANLRDGELQTRYMFAGCYSMDENDAFATYEAAGSRAEVLTIEHVAAEAKRLKSKERDTKTWAWNVSYWRKEIRDAKQTIERATARLNMAPKKGEADGT